MGHQNSLENPLKPLDKEDNNNYRIDKIYLSALCLISHNYYRSHTL